MSAYLQIDLDITKLEGFMEYARPIPVLINKHDGRYIVQGVEPTIIEESGNIPQRSVILEFPSRQAAESFLKERANSDLHQIWSETTRGRILVLERNSE